MPSAHQRWGYEFCDRLEGPAPQLTNGLNEPM